MLNDLVLKVKNLNVEIEGEKIIEDLSFEVKKGEILTILGPNGAGKTILLRTLLGFLPYQGEIFWQEPNLKIGYLPQGLTQLKVKYLPLSVEEFFQLKNPHQLPSLEVVGIEEKSFLKKRIGDLSSGQFQRVLIAWVLIGDPQILFFDEPESQLDVGGEETIYSFLYRFWQGKDIKGCIGKYSLSDTIKNEANRKTILLITHDLDIVYKYSTSVLCLNKSKICQGPAREILTPEVLEKTYNQEIKFYHHNHQ